MDDTESIVTGNIVISPRPIDTGKKGSMRKMRDVLRIGEAAKRGESAAIDKIIDFIIENSDIKAPQGIDIHEALLDELSRDELLAILNRIKGSEPVSPTNGD